MLKTICTPLLLIIPLSVFLTACGEGASSSPSAGSTTASAAEVRKFEETPVWADEFNTNGKPDTTKWGYDTSKRPYKKSPLFLLTSRVEG